MSVKRLSDFKPGDGHPCQPSIADVSSRRPSCMYCRQTLVRILHGPKHTIGGRSCGFPDTWRHCFLPATIVDRPSDNLLILPEWSVG